MRVQTENLTDTENRLNLTSNCYDTLLLKQYKVIFQLMLGGYLTPAKMVKYLLKFYCKYRLSLI